MAFVACGAITQPAKKAAVRHGWPLDIHAIPPAIHNRPQEIAGAVERLVGELRPRYERVVVGFADCGTYGALDETCARLGVERLPGLYCYDLYAGSDPFAALLEEQPGTYVLTDFLLHAFDRLVVRELGLDRHPELRDDYFRHYTRLVWLAQEPDDPDLRRRADDAADRIGLPLEVVPTGYSGLEHALAHLLA